MTLHAIRLLFLAAIVTCAVFVTSCASSETAGGPPPSSPKPSASPSAASPAENDAFRQKLLSARPERSGSVPNPVMKRLLAVVRDRGETVNVTVETSSAAVRESVLYILECDFRPWKLQVKEVASAGEAHIRVTAAFTDATRAYKDPSRISGMVSGKVVTGTITFTVPGGPSWHQDLKAESRRTVTVSATEPAETAIEKNAAGEFAGVLQRVMNPPEYVTGSDMPRW